MLTSIKMIHSQTSRLCFAFVVILLSLVDAEPLPEAHHVCNINLPTKKDITVDKPIKYEIKYQGMCGILPCTKIRTEIRIDQTTKTIIQNEVRPTCCPGYVETVDRRCAPVCTKSCSNGGKCVAPNECKCSSPPGEWTPGFTGFTCARFTCLNSSRWGAKCDKTCNCPLNSYCSANSGKCYCNPGYRGENCTARCETNDDHPECEEIVELPMSEPDVNLISSEALVLERTPDETLREEDESSSFGANYLVGVLACCCLVAFLSVLIYKRRYDRLKTEMVYGSSPSSSGSTNGSGDYAGSTFYASQSGLSGVSSGYQQPDDMLAKNLSFAAATRHALLGSDEAKTNNTQQSNETGRNKLIVNPLIESHLMRSQKASEQNLYSDVKINFLDRPLPNPNQSSASIDMTKQHDHIYQVPRSQANGSMNDSSTTNDTSADSANLASIADNEIYEEIKPKSSL